MKNATPVLDAILGNDEDLRAHARKMLARPAPAVTKPHLTVKEQDDRTRRLRYKPWSVR